MPIANRLVVPPHPLFVTAGSSAPAGIELTALLCGIGTAVASQELSNQFQGEVGVALGRAKSLMADDKAKLDVLNAAVKTLAHFANKTAHSLTAIFPNMTLDDAAHMVETMYVSPLAASARGQAYVREFVDMPHLSDLQNLTGTATTLSTIKILKLMQINNVLLPGYPDEVVGDKVFTRGSQFNALLYQNKSDNRTNMTIIRA